MVLVCYKERFWFSLFIPGPLRSNGVSKSQAHEERWKIDCGEKYSWMKVFPPIPGQWLPFPGQTPTISRSNPYQFPGKGFHHFHEILKFSWNTKNMEIFEIFSGKNRICKEASLHLSVKILAFFAQRSIYCTYFPCWIPGYFFCVT